MKEEIDDFVIRKLSKLFNVLSNESRIKIIYTLMENESLSVTELADKVGIPQNTLSAQLKILYEGSYVDKNQKWRNVHYYICEPKLKEILEIGSKILHDKWSSNFEKIDHAQKIIEKINGTKGKGNGKNNS
ncbi:MAG: winged helix-turn-helix transcriptional regulator [Candidatus Cloacimonetes bacterium]|nr:winged helix-turn-helix transcriptional regulator [Candidatus Cloacimonadota bacterium]